MSRITTAAHLEEPRSPSSTLPGGWRSNPLASSGTSIAGRGGRRGGAMSSNPTKLDPELLEQFLGALVMMTTEGQILSWNRGAEILYGYSAGQALGQSVFDLIIPPERAGETRDQIEKALMAGAAIYESSRRRNDGSFVVVAVSLRIVKDAEGRTLIAKNDRDISDLTYLRQSQRLDAKFRGMLEAAPDAMGIMNYDGRLVLVKGQAERLV